MRKQSIVDRTEVESNGNIGVRLKKQLVEDDGTEINFEYHRTVMPPGADIDAQLSLINDHLAQMGYPAVEGWARVVAIANATWTPEVIADFQAAQAAALPA